MDIAELQLKTTERTELKPVTGMIEDHARRHGWMDGVITLFVPHTTSGITINENADPDVASDMKMFFDELVPRSASFRHSEGNSDAHIKASLTGSSLQVIVRGGRLWLGTWQGIYFCEFDGPRTRKLCLAFT